MNREKFKTLILSILVAMSILLVQQLWFPSPIEILTTKTKSGKESSVTVTEVRKNVISPKTIMVSFGAGDMKKNYYTVLSSNLDFVWEESKDILEDYFLGDPEITQITKEEYTQGNTLKAVELEFPENMPTILVSSVFDSFENKIIRNINGINRILIPAFNRGIIYIVDSEENIFQVKLSKYEENLSLANFIDELEKVEYIKYHPYIYSLFDESDGNYTPMPINYAVSATQTFVKSGINIEDESMLIESSKKFFNENFDFVKTVKETSGAVVYIYGYGEKSVRISSKGVLEYKEEIGNISSTNVVTSLDAAINFISQKGEFPDSTYLRDIKEISFGESDENTGYLFSFGYRIGGYPVDFNSDELEYPIEVEVYGNKVKTYRSLVRNVMDMQGVTPEQSVLYFPDIIEKNIEDFELQYFNTETQSGEEMNVSEKIFEILKNIEEVRMVYFDTVEESKGQLLKPSWRIKIKGDTYYFDSYTGELINSVTLN